jgi:hypothetical protein
VEPAAIGILRNKQPDADALAKNTKKLLMQSELDKLDAEDAQVKAMVQASEDFAHVRLEKMGLNKPKRDMNQDLADY